MDHRRNGRWAQVAVAMATVALLGSALAIASDRTPGERGGPDDALEAIESSSHRPPGGTDDWAWQNPFLAENPYSNIHNDSWFTDTYPQPGPFSATSADVRVIEKFLFNDPTDGTVRFVVLGECAAHAYDSLGNLVSACAGIPNPTTMQFERHIITLSPEGELLAWAEFPDPFDNFAQALDDFSGIGYFYLDEQNRVVMGMPDGHIVTWERQSSDQSKVDAWTPVRDVNINGPGGPVPEERGKLYALVPGENGFTWFTTTKGVVGTVEPEGCTVDCVRWIDINDPDGDGTLDPQPDGGFQKISESHSVDGNSTFQQSDYFMYRFDMQSDGTPEIAWQAEYDRGRRVKPGQTSRGSGTSPSFFEMGGREFVAIMDNAVRPHINVYRAESEIGRREERLFASRRPFGPNRKVSDENSLIVYPGSRPNSMRIFGENNWGNTSFLATAGPNTTQPGFGGIEVSANGRSRALEPNETISVPSIVSKGSIGADALYTYEKREFGWWLTALDPDDLDNVLWSVRVGTGTPKYNNWYSQVSLAPDSATFYVGVPQGLLRIRPSDGPPPPDQCSSLLDAQDVVTILADLGEWEAGPIWAPDYVEASMFAWPAELARLRDGSPPEATYQRDALDRMIADLGNIDSLLASAGYDVTRLTPAQKEAIREFAEEHERLIIELFLFWAVRCTDIELNGDLMKDVRIMLYRSYLPTDGFDSVVLPDITLVEDGVETALPACALRADNEALGRYHVDQSLDIITTMSALAETANITPNDNPAPWCSWWGLSSVDTLNVAAPDENAAYWYMPLIAGDDTEVYIDGEYQDSRYMSIAMYSATANPYDYNQVSSTIPDYLIDPAPGFENPWQVPATPGGEFRVTVVADPADGERNVLPWFTTDPDGAKPTMPAPCGDEGAQNVACPLSNMFMSPPAADQTGIFSNVDNRYMMSLFEPDSVQVLRGKLPTTPDGTHPVPWPDPRYQLRYFSICDIVYVRPYPAVTENGCAVDDEIPVDGAGFYTIVYSTAENRPDNATPDNGVVWIEARAEVRNFLVMRHMLPSNDFDEAAQNVPRDGAWQSAYTQMGDYYPATNVTCNKAAFEISPSKCSMPPPPTEVPAFVAGATVSE